MKKLIISIFITALSIYTVAAQQSSSSSALSSSVKKLDQAKTVKDYQTLEKEFSGIAIAQKTNWLPYYYAAFCNARIGFLYQDNGEDVEPYSNRGETLAQKAKSLLDTAKQKKELSELYTIFCMINQSRVFINQMSYGPKYGPIAQQYLNKAKQFNPENPRAIFMEAWFKYNTPKMWGGDKDLAKQLAMKSLKLLQSGPSEGEMPHWGQTENTELLNKYKN